MIHSAEISSVNLVLFRPIRSRLLINLDSTNQDSINPSTNQMLVLLRQQYLDQLQLRTVLSVLKYHGAMIHLPLLQLQLLQPHNKQAVIHGLQATAIKRLHHGPNQLQQQLQLEIHGLLLAMIQQMTHFKKLLIHSG